MSNRILQRNRARLCKNLVLDQLQPRSLRRIGQQGHSSSEQDRDHCDRHLIDEPRLKQTAEQNSTTEEPDVFARLLLQRWHRM
jgi:hypothetical protein